MKYKFPDIDPEKINITRELYNRKKYREDLLLKDIIEVELALDIFDYNKLDEDLRNYGFRMERMGNKIIAYGPDINIIILDKTKEKAGICRIKLSLNDHQYIEQTIDFGEKSKLILNPDKTAEWFFDIQ
jgi:hypothetical protein